MKALRNLCKISLVLLCSIALKTNADENDYFYPSAKAIKDNYSCCLYLGSAELDLECKEEDLECIDDYRSLMNSYYIAGGIIALVPTTVLFILCFIAYRKDRKAREKQKLHTLDDSQDDSKVELKLKGNRKHSVMSGDQGGITSMKSQALKKLHDRTNSFETKQ